MTERKTITFDEHIYEQIKKVQAEFIASADDFDDMSFTSAVNMLVLGGLVFAPEDEQHEEWATVRDFLQDRSFELNQSSALDREVEKRFIEGTQPQED